jgi:MFS transporter, PAT family, solute carrier family 33 (acetyl-CoA transportor), member 1
MFNGDLGNVTLLVVLYCLQGVPLGLGLVSIPYLLKKHLTYKELATFSLAAYPFSLKFFWSPIVDSYYIPWIGRRKSWIIPLQSLSGVLMVYLSYYIEDMLLSSEYIYSLTLYFFIIVLLYATQDIAVDGWAVEILKPENQFLASTSQSIGQTIGFFMSFTGLLALNSKEFCNNYIFTEPMDHGLVSVSLYMYTWGLINILVSIFLIFKQEKLTTSTLSIKEIYFKIYECAKTPNFKYLILILLTSKLGTSFNDSALMLVLTEKGLKETDLGMIAFVMLPFDIGICALVSVYLKRSSSELSLYYKGIIFKIFCAVYGLVVLQLFPSDGEISYYYYFILLFGNFLSSIAMSCTYVSICGFFNKIADISMAGTVLTFLNAINNFGSSLPRYCVYKAISFLTVKEQCIEVGCPDCVLECTKGTHGYYPLAFISLFFSFFYIFVLKKLIKKVESFPRTSWVHKETKGN